MAIWEDRVGLALEEAEPSGVTIQQGTEGSYWLVRSSVLDRWPDYQSFVDRYPGTVKTLPLMKDPELAELARTDPINCLWVDIETTALSSAPLFLIGTMHYEGHDFHMTQYFARSFEEEKPVIEAAMKEMGDFTLVITYNGKIFDLPYIKDRATHHKTVYRDPIRHLDMLPVSRRYWKSRFGNCKLQTLETGLCGRQRVDDIPGQDIPAAYHDFVRTGDATKMKAVLYHNALDLLTLAELTLKASQE